MCNLSDEQIRCLLRRANTVLRQHSPLTRRVILACFVDPQWDSAQLPEGAVAPISAALGVANYSTLSMTRGHKLPQHDNITPAPPLRQTHPASAGKS